MQLIIDGLETVESPYRYAVVQATEGSIPFYERMGFVRVGAVTAQVIEGAAAEGAAAEGGSKKKQKATVEAAAPPQAQEVVSPHVWHETGQYETCASTAELYGVDIFDVVFLNRRRFPGLNASAILKRGTRLQVPQSQSVQEIRAQAIAGRQTWHTVPEESSIKKEALRLGMSHQTLLALNRERIRGLALSSVILKGTRLQTSGNRLDNEEYAHWTFPDDDDKEGCPSYMMARRLKPHAERSPPPAASVLARSKALLQTERPPVKPSGKRARFVSSIVSPVPELQGVHG